VLADVVDICTGRYQATANRFRFFTTADKVALLPEEEELTASYARFVVPDRAGVLAGITNALSTNGVNVLSIHQGTPDQFGKATIQVVTHPLRSRSFFSAIGTIDSSGLTLQPTATLRRL
jgi:ACT domain-containing protein